MGKVRECTVYTYWFQGTIQWKFSKESKIFSLLCFLKYLDSYLFKVGLYTSQDQQGLGSWHLN